MSQTSKYYDKHQEELAKALRENLKKRRTQKVERTVSTKTKDNNKEKNT